MVIIAYKAIREFSALHPMAEAALQDWFEKTQAADWKNIVDVRNTFNGADFVGNERVVFNIRGNHYRLIAAVVYKSRTVYIKFIGTHAEYDAIDAASIEQY